MEENSLQAQWTQVDHYINDLFIPSDPILDAVLESGASAGLPPHNVSPNQGKFLYLLSRIRAARNILEIGTLAGYSTIWLARSLPADGHIISLESDPLCVKIAQANIEHAGVADIVEIIPGKALDTLPRLVDKQPFDLIFIDADKVHNPEYFSWALKLSKVGSLIIIDNVIRNGSVIDIQSVDPSVQGVRRLNEVIGAESRVSATTIQTVGSKGYDGFTLALVVSE